MKPSVTIVIVNFNSGDMLGECLDHCLRQTVLPEQIVVVDNASQDDSLMGIEALPRVRVMRMDQNIGFAAGNNRAIEQCTTQWVLLLNPDAFAEPNWLEELMKAAAEKPDVVAFGCRQMQLGKEGVLDGIGDRYLISGQIRRHRYQMPCRPDDLVAKEVFSPCAAAAMYRLDALRDCGGFDEDFFCYAEDVDLGFRLRLAGHTAWYIPTAVVQHIGSAAAGGQHSDFATFYGHRNLVWVFVKNMPGWLFWVLLPLHLILNLASLAWLGLRGQGRIAFKAKIAALAAIPLIWRKRSHVSANRRASIASIWKQLDKRLMTL